MYICDNDILPYNIHIRQHWSDTGTYVYITFPYGRWEGDKGCQAINCVLHSRRWISVRKSLNP